MSETSDRWSVTLAGETLLGRYRVERMIGGGGMANVYLAQDEQLEIPVVVKVPHTAFLAEAGFRERFDRETRDLVTLQHPHIVRILARGEHEGLPFLVMQFLQGGSLGDRMRKAKGPMPFADVEPWVRDIAKALDFIHVRGIVHRDIKPDNVLFDEYGHAFLSDFGIAKAVGGADTGLTVTGATPGSPAYMAPEQPRISALTGQSDQYSYAAALYEALSGRPTFEGETAVDVLIQKQSKLPAHLAETTPAIPRTAANAIMRGLAKDPEERFASCTALVEAMFADGAAAPAPRPASGVRPAPRVAPSPTTVLPERAPAAAVPAAPTPRTESVGRTATLSGATKALWVVFALVVAVPVAFLALSRDDTPEGSVDTAERGAESQTPAEGPKDGEIGAFHSPKPPKDEDPGLPPAVAKEGAARRDAALVGSYVLDRPAFEGMLRKARSASKGRPKPPRGVGNWADMERAAKSGMDVTLRADGTFRLLPPGRPGKEPAALEGTWQRMDDVVVLKPSSTSAAKRGPRVFELRMRAGGGLVFVFGKMSIPLAKR
ncbi:MAG: serine/threonine-protein kinase [Planctomycetota bacterium]|nr:serine/threonine-protein kinase [Planctomycetota bacterium]